MALRWDGDANPILAWHAIYGRRWNARNLETRGVMDFPCLCGLRSCYKLVRRDHPAFDVVRANEAVIGDAQELIANREDFVRWNTQLFYGCCDVLRLAIFKSRKQTMLGRVIVALSDEADCVELADCRPAFWQRPCDAGRIKSD